MDYEMVVAKAFGIKYVIRLKVRRWWHMFRRKVGKVWYKL